MKFLYLNKVDSTNNYVAAHVGELSDMTMVIARTQTAGRGQRGNTWVSEPGKILTFTLLCRPEGVAVREHFAISEAVALAVADCVEEILADKRMLRVAVKWPNDVYVGDRKVAGILIEHSVTPARIEHSRIGVGVNVNQRDFGDGAPNAVSIASLAGLPETEELNLDSVAGKMAFHLERRLESVSRGEAERAAIHREFLGRLWRFDGNCHRFKRRGEAMIFDGKILGVDPRGPIRVEDEATGEASDYAFKEIEFIVEAESVSDNETDDMAVNRAGDNGPKMPDAPENPEVSAPTPVS